MHDEQVGTLEHELVDLVKPIDYDYIVIDYRQERENMEGIMTVGELIEALREQPEDAPVMIAVVKYPEEFTIRAKGGKATWSDHTDVECIPLEQGEITVVDGVVTIAVELTDYDAQRHFAGG